MTKLRSSVGLALLICMSICTAGEFTIGQAVFLRSTGTPRTDTLTFAAPCLSCQYTLNLENGSDGTCRVSSADVWLNGTQVVFGTSDFNQQVARLQKPVTLSSSNLVNVCLRSSPGCAMKINVAGLENTPPSIHIATPVEGSVTNSTRPRIVVTYSDHESGLDLTTLRITIDGIDHTGEFTVGTDSAACPSITPLTDGEITVIAAISDRAGNSAHDTLRFFVDTKPPVVQILSPIAGFLTTISRVVVDWVVDGVHQVTQTFENLAEGVNAIVRTATDAAGNIGADTVRVTLDTHPPGVEITLPADGFLTNQRETAVEWTIDGSPQITQITQMLEEGESLVIRTATDAAGNVGADTIRVTLDTRPPVVAISNPEPDFLTNQTPINVTWTVDGVEQTTLTAHDLVEGANTITRTATDAAGNVGTASVTGSLDTKAPSVEIASPVPGFLTNMASIAVTWFVDGIQQLTQAIESLIEGANKIIRTATDSAGNSGADTIEVSLDTQAPVVSISVPAESVTVRTSPVSVAWFVDGIAQSTQTTESLVDGWNTIIRTACDGAGNCAGDTVHVCLQREPTCLTIENVTVHWYDYREIECLLIKNNGVVHSYNGLKVGVLKILDGGTLYTDSGLVTVTTEIASGGLLTHHQCDSLGRNRVDLTADSLSVQAGGKIDATGRGFTAGRSIEGRTNTIAYGGGTHCGKYPSSPFPVYGDYLRPIYPGSGGGVLTAGSSGGGVVRLAVGYLQLRGSIAADGATYYYGDGAGGSVWITAQRVDGDGSISANGGWYYNPGSGGRIAVHGTDFTGTFLTRFSATGFSAGTIYTEDAHGNHQLIVRGNGNCPYVTEMPQSLDDNILHVYLGNGSKFHVAGGV